MSNFSIEATARTPSVHLNYQAKCFEMAGESYPEDVPAFFAQMNEQLDSYFAASKDELLVEIKLTYFNSSSARALMEMLDNLDSEAASGRKIDVNWHCDPDDDITREFAQDISSDATHIQVTICDLAPLDAS